MPASFSLEFLVNDVVVRVRSIEGRFDDPSDLMTDHLLLLIRTTQQNFEAGGRPDRWPDLAESTERARFRKAMRGRRARAGGALAALGGIQILRDSGVLMQSLGAGASGAYTHSQGSGSSDELTATLTTNRPGAVAHQLGYAEGNIPQRIIVLFQVPDDINDLMTMTADFMMMRGPYAA